MKELTISEVIRNRRTIRMLSEFDEVIPIDIIYDLLEKASYAPFHSKKKPWQVIIASEKEERAFFVNQLMASYKRLNVWEKYDLTFRRSSMKKTEAYFSKVPITLIVSAPIEKEKKKELESICAVASFIQNFQLLAWEQKIGVT